MPDLFACRGEDKQAVLSPDPHAAGTVFADGRYKFRTFPIAFGATVIDGDKTVLFIQKPEKAVARADPHLLVPVAEHSVYMVACDLRGRAGDGTGMF